MFRVLCIVNVCQSMTNTMQRYTVFYFCKLLYMFWVDPPPIIRSTKLYLQHLVFVKQLLLPAAIVKETATNDCTCIKHVLSIHLFLHLIINGYVFLQMYNELLQKTWKIHINVNAINFHMLTDNIQAAFNIQALCVLYIGKAFRYTPENAFHIFNQQIYFII